MVKTARKRRNLPGDSRILHKSFYGAYHGTQYRQAEIIPKATEHIKEMLEFVEGLVEKGYGYETSDGIYFDIMKFKGYGKLSRLDRKARKREQGRCEHGKGIRPTSRSGRKLRRSISCSGRAVGAWVIPDGTSSALRWRGNISATNSIYTRRRGPIPVHHENEIAQTEALLASLRCGTGCTVSSCWWTTGKMSKSLGNTYTVDDLKKEGI